MRRIIEGAYARLKGLQQSVLNTREFVIDESHHADYSSILEELRKNIDDEFSGFDLSQDSLELNRPPHYRGVRAPLVSKLNQLVNYLEAVHNSSNRVVEIGSAYNLIHDSELRSRCADLLSATGHFDRVINQATQVLEERIRIKAPDMSGEIGTNLVNQAIKADPANSPIKFSDEKSEQEGYAAIMRGLVGAFRNPSHHRFLENITREQALQICAFIDNMLIALENSEIQQLGQS